MDKKLKQAMKSVKKIRDSYLLILSLNVAELKNVADVFGVVLGQVFTDELLEEFKKTGKQNIDFLFSDFLPKKGYRNILKVKL